MKTEDKNIVIYVRDSKNGKRIQLVKRIVEQGIRKYKRISTGEFATDENLQRYRINATKEWEELTQEHPKKLSFEAFLPTALKIILEDCNEKSSKDILQKINAYILPAFGKSAIQYIEASDIEDWQYNLKDWKQADLTKRTKNILSRIFDRAVVEKVCIQNPLIGTKVVKRKRSERKVKEIYSKEEIKLMLQYSQGWLRVFIMLFVYTGIRPNEAIALRWIDVLWRKEKIHIRYAINNGLLHSPKTGERLVDIPKVLFKALQELYLRSENSKWIFPSSFGTPYREASSINRRHFKPLLVEIGIRYRTMYTLKHSFATHSIMGGQKIAYVSKQLGHAEIETTLKFYTKFIDEVESKEKTNEILIY